MVVGRKHSSEQLERKQGCRQGQTGNRRLFQQQRRRTGSLPACITPCAYPTLAAAACRMHLFDALLCALSAFVPPQKGGRGVVWCGVVWCGVVWCGVVWCGVVWCGCSADSALAAAACRLCVFVHICLPLVGIMHVSHRAGVAWGGRSSMSLAVRTA
jgi:hypothetical protein